MSDSWLERWLADLERQASAQALIERDQEVEELARDTYRGVGWADRLRGSVGLELSLDVNGYGTATGTLARVGRDWFLLRGAGGVDLVVMTGAVTSVRGLGADVVAADAQPVWSRLGVGSLLREAIAEGRPLRAFLTDGSQTQGTPVRVGADFVEVSAGRGQGASVLPWAGVAALTLR